jgi:maleate isomerase
MTETASSRRAIGLIVPSSNRVVERVAGQLLAEHPGIDCCVARVPYGGIVAAGSTPSYIFKPFEAAAILLAEASVDVICWNATRGAVLGFDADRELCRRIEDKTGIPVVTTALATVEMLLDAQLRRVGLITQGDEAESRHILDQFRAQGCAIVDHLWLDITDNLSAAALGGEALLMQARKLANRSALDAVLVWSTNLSGYAARASQGVSPDFAILDSAAIGIAAALAGIGISRRK